MSRVVTYAVVKAAQLFLTVVIGVFLTILIAKSPEVCHYLILNSEDDSAPKRVYSQDGDKLSKTRDSRIGRCAAAVIFSGLAMFSVGYLIAGVAPGALAAQVVGMAIFYPKMFLSGATIPLEVMPEGVRRIADFLPLTYVVRLLRGLWFGEP
jgi:ABC-2 type transport system permease protein